MMDRGRSEESMHRPVRRSTVAMLSSIAATLLFVPVAFASGPSLDVVFVLDNSGSMRQNDPAFLTRQAVSNFAEALAAEPEREGRIAIVLFDAQSRLVQPLTPVEAGSATRSLAAPLATLDFSGQYTNSPSGIERALYELRENGRDGAGKAIIFLTDGKIDTGSPEGDLEAGRWLREDLAGESLAEGIRIFGVAFTEAADYQLMQALALKTQASYYRAFEADQLDAVVTDVLGQINDPESVQWAELDAGVDAARSALPEEPQSSTPSVASAAVSTPEESPRYEFLGWLPVLLFLAAGSLIWSYRRRTASDPTPTSDNIFIDVDPVTPKAQLLDFGGQIGEVGGVLALGSDRTTIGRDPHNDIVLDDDAISSEHALIEVRNGRYWLEDRRSTNGTRLDDKRLVAGQPVQLKGGDHIQLGEIELMFALAGYIPGGSTVFLNSATTAPPGWQSTSHPTSASTHDRVTDVEEGADVGDLSDARADRGHISLLPALEIEDPSTRPGADSDEEGSHPIRPVSSSDVFRNCLDFHLEQVQEISPALADFVDRGFDGEMRDALSVAADELVRAAQDADSIEQKAYTAAAIRYVICAVPDSMERTRDRFGRVYGGFTRLLSGALQDDTFVRDGCRILVVLTFGRATEADSTPWVSLSIVPDEGQDPRIDLLSYEFLTDEERIEIEAGVPAEPGQSSRA